MSWEIHLHIISATAWIGGSIFMFVLGLSLKDEKARNEVYPHIGSIFGYFEMVSLLILLITGFLMINQNGLITLLMQNRHDILLDALRAKLLVVLVVVILTIIHTIIAFKTTAKRRTFWEQLFSRGSSLLIFFLNLLILHYAMILREVL